MYCVTVAICQQKTFFKAESELKNKIKTYFYAAVIYQALFRAPLKLLVQYSIWPIVLILRKVSMFAIGSMLTIPLLFIPFGETMLEKIKKNLYEKGIWFPDRECERSKQRNASPPQCP